jgi:hypothetical protein
MPPDTLDSSWPRFWARRTNETVSGVLAGVSPNTDEPGSDAGSAPCATLVIGSEPAAMAAVVPTVSASTRAATATPLPISVRIRASLQTIDVTSEPIYEIPLTGRRKYISAAR